MALSERDRRTVTIGGIVVGVLLAGFVLFSVLGGGEEAFPPIPETPLPPSSPSPSPGRRRTPDPELHRARPLLRPARPVALAVPGPSGGPSGSPSGSPSGGPVRIPVADDAGQRLESERGRVHGRPARRLPARRCDARPGGGRRHRLRRRHRGAVRRRAVRAAHRSPTAAPRSCSATSGSPSASPRRNRPRRSAHGGSGRRRGGGARAAPAHPAGALRPGRWGPLRCLRAQDAHGR